MSEQGGGSSWMEREAQAFATERGRVRDLERQLAEIHVVIEKYDGPYSAQFPDWEGGYASASEDIVADLRAALEGKS